MRRLIGAALAGLALACASAGTPPGGPEDHTPPQIVSITPDSGETNVKLKHVEFKFDEVVSDRPVGAAQLDQIFLISPRNGQPDVSWHRTRIDVRPKNGFRANTAYRVTMLPGIVDLRSNVRKVATSIVFSTGSGFPPMSILGRVFDWAAQRPANGAYIEATLRTDTTVVYLGATDSLGEFDVGPLPPGIYTVRALIDANNNRMLDRNEKWDTATVAVRDIRPHFDMLAIERDTTPAALESITALDSVSLRVTFDKPLDPRIPLQPALVRLQHADSSAIEVARVQWQSEWDRQKLARDSARKADSLKAAQPPGAAAPTPACAASGATAGTTAGSSARRAASAETQRPSAGSRHRRDDRPAVTVRSARDVPDHRERPAESGRQGTRAITHVHRAEAAAAATTKTARGHGEEDTAAAVVRRINPRLDRHTRTNDRRSPGVAQCELAPRAATAFARCSIARPAPWSWTRFGERSTPRGPRRPRRQ